MDPYIKEIKYLQKQHDEMEPEDINISIREN